MDSKDSNGNLYWRYPGPSPFPEIGRAPNIFFGRDEAISSFKKLLDGRNQLIILHGQTGVGKSSFIKAGVIRELAQQEKHATSWETKSVYLDIHSLFQLGKNNPSSLAQEVASHIENEIGISRANRISTTLEETKLPSSSSDTRSTMAGLLHNILNPKSENKQQKKALILFIDQLDHISDFSPNEKTLFFDLIQGIHDIMDSEFGNLHTLKKIVLVIRSEFLSILMDLSQRIPSAFNGVYELPPISFDDCEESIAHPAILPRKYGEQIAFASESWEFSPSLLSKIIDCSTSSNTNQISLLDMQRTCREIEKIQKKGHVNYLTETKSIDKILGIGREKYIQRLISEALNKTLRTGRYGKKFGFSWVRNFLRRYQLKSQIFYRDLCIGGRRLHIRQEDLHKYLNPQQSKTLVDFLSSEDNRILSKSLGPSGEARLNYSHDLLAETANNVSVGKLKRRNFLIGVMSVASMIFATVFIADRIRENEDIREQAISSQVKARLANKNLNTRIKEQAEILKNNKNAISSLVDKSLEYPESVDLKPLLQVAKTIYGEEAKSSNVLNDLELLNSFKSSFSKATSTNSSSSSSIQKQLVSGLNWNAFLDHVNKTDRKNLSEIIDHCKTDGLEALPSPDIIFSTDNTYRIVNLVCSVPNSANEQGGANSIIESQSPYKVISPDWLFKDKGISSFSQLGTTSGKYDRNGDSIAILFRRQGRTTLLWGRIKDGQKDVDVLSKDLPFSGITSLKIIPSLTSDENLYIVFGTEDGNLVKASMPIKSKLEQSNEVKFLKWKNVGQTIDSLAFQVRDDENHHLLISISNQLQLRELDNFTLLSTLSLDNVARIQKISPKTTSSTVYVDTNAFDFTNISSIAIPSPSFDIIPISDSIKCRVTTTGQPIAVTITDDLKYVFVGGHNGDSIEGIKINSSRNYENSVCLETFLGRSESLTERLTSKKEGDTYKIGWAGRNRILKNKTINSAVIAYKPSNDKIVSKTAHSAGFSLGNSIKIDDSFPLVTTFEPSIVTKEAEYFGKPDQLKTGDQYVSSVLIQKSTSNDFYIAARSKLLGYSCIVRINRFSEAIKEKWLTLNKDEQKSIRKSICSSENNPWLVKTKIEANLNWMTRSSLGDYVISVDSGGNIHIIDIDKNVIKTFQSPDLNVFWKVKSLHTKNNDDLLVVMDKSGSFIFYRITFDSEKPLKKIYEIKVPRIKKGDKVINLAIDFDVKCSLDTDKCLLASPLSSGGKFNSGELFIWEFSL